MPVTPEGSRRPEPVRIAPMARCFVCGDIQVERMVPMVLCGSCDVADTRLLLFLYGTPLLLFAPPVVIAGFVVVMILVGSWPQTYPYVPLPPQQFR